MELSAIGEQVFAVESIVKKRVRKVTVIHVVPRCRTLEETHLFFGGCYFGC